MDNVEDTRTFYWRWWIAGLLLFASMINYMDRQTLSSLAVRIENQFQLSQEQYGNLEFGFGVAFAIGALSFGMIVDKISLRWFYPAALVAWSAMGFATGLTESYSSLLLCRILLGFFESAHIPCAMVVIRSLMSRGDRVMGSSILQSGASIGAIMTPLIIGRLAGDESSQNGWRLPFLVIGAIGSVWAIFWLASVGRHDLKPQPQIPTNNARPPAFAWLYEILTDTRFWALCVTTISINTCWHILRVWLPKFLQQGRGYTEAETLYFTSAYYVSADVGCIVIGGGALWLAKRGMSIHSARTALLASCSVLTMLTIAAASLPKGWPLLAVLLVVGAGSLGTFPCYYAQIQEFGAGRVGRVAGMLSFTTWMCSASQQKLFGRFVDQTGSFDWPIAVVGCIPMLSVFAMLFLWREPKE
ncbi:MAG: MFS transporter [Planctomycetota bacterium]|nr:MFS transporter [Planctomycetota bacterium]